VEWIVLFREFSYFYFLWLVGWLLAGGALRKGVRLHGWDRMCQEGKGKG